MLFLTLLILPGECILLGSVLSQQRLGVMDIKALSASQLSGLGQTVLQLSGLQQTVLQLLDKSVLQPRVTALFYLENSRRIHPLGIRACQPNDATKRDWGSAPAHRRERGRERERERAIWLLFLFVFSYPPGPALCKLGQLGVLFLLPEFLTLVLGSSFVLYSWAFPFLVFKKRPPFWTPVSYSNYPTI